MRKANLLMKKESAFHLKLVLYLKASISLRLLKTKHYSKIRSTAFKLSTLGWNSLPLQAEVMEFNLLLQAKVVMVLRKLMRVRKMIEFHCPLHNNKRKRTD